MLAGRAFWRSPDATQQSHLTIVLLNTESVSQAFLPPATHRHPQTEAPGRTRYARDFPLSEDNRISSFARVRPTHPTAAQNKPPAVLAKQHEVTEQCENNAVCPARTIQPIPQTLRKTHPRT